MSIFTPAIPLSSVAAARLPESALLPAPIREPRDRVGGQICGTVRIRVTQHQTQELLSGLGNHATGPLILNHSEAIWLYLAARLARLDTHGIEVLLNNWTAGELAPEESAVHLATCAEVDALRLVIADMRLNRPALLEYKLWLWAVAARSGT